MSAQLKRLAELPAFQNFITFVIVLAGVLIGVETYPDIVHHYHGLLHTLDKIILGIFIFEIAVKMGAEGSRPWRFFNDPWNVFDFIVVAATFIPGAGQYAVVLRLARLLRVLRLLRALPQLQLLVGALLKSIPSMFYVTILLLLSFYVYAVAGVFIFGANDPHYFGSLQVALLTLFRVVTLEGWTEILYIQYYGCDVFGYEGREALCTAPQAMPLVATAYFVSFVLLGTMIILNLFVGVIMNGMEAAHEEAVQEAAGQAGVDLDKKLAEVGQHLDELRSIVHQMREELARKSDS